MKKRKPHIVLLLLLCLIVISVSGCGAVTRLSCSVAATDTDVKTFFTQKVSILTSDPFTVDIIGTETLNVPTATGIGGPKNYKDVPGAHKFTVKITVKAPSGTYEIFDYYQDAYTLNGQNHAVSSTNYYSNSIHMHQLMDKCAQYLEQYGIKDYIFTEDRGDQYNDFGVFLYSQDYDAINSALEKFKVAADDNSLANISYNAYGVYIFTDKSAFDSIKNLSIFGRTDVIDDSIGRTWGGDGIEMITGKDATRIGSATAKFDKELFDTKGEAYAATDKEYRDYQSFDYVVFWAYAEPNTNGICDVQLFGVK